MWKWQEAQRGQVGTFSLLESPGVSVRDSASQKLRETLSRSPALGVRDGHLAFPGPALGWAACTVVWGSLAPGVLGVCSCSELWGIMLSSLSLERGWLELAE